MGLGPLEEWTRASNQAARELTSLASAPEASAPRVRTVEVHRFTLVGNTVLDEQAIARATGAATGPAVDYGQIREALLELQRTYRERGYLSATVFLPRQVLLDGTVTIQVLEGRPPVAAVPPLDGAEPPAVSAPAPSSPTFEVRRYEVTGNTLLRPEMIDGILTNATGPAVSLPQIRKALGDLQLAYRERGFATVSVGLPQQKLTNAVVQVQVTEGVLVDIQVTGHRYFSSNNVRAALPSLRTNELFNSRIFQRELDAANQNRDRQIFPVLGPGPEPGTSALTLRVKDRLPLHGRLELNNQATPGTPEWRVNASAQFNNLWQREHQLGVSYGFTPEEFKSEGLMSDYLFNRPLISYSGAYYRLPFGTAESVSEQVNTSRGFGYDEATRQFRLPPAGFRPDLTLFASSSSSDTGVKKGPASVVSQTPLLTILSQDSGQNLTINHSAGARLGVPRPLDDQRRWSWSGGLDAKLYSLDSYNTNNFIIITVVTNSQGSQTIVSQVASPQPKRHAEVRYLPLTLGADYSQSDAHGTFQANLSASGNFLGSDNDYVVLAASRQASARFGKASVFLTRDQRVFKTWSLLLRASGQMATGPLISNEQFALGGLNSVRGYYEGDEYGDAGWFGSAELRTPYLAREVPIGPNSSPIWLRGSVFVDGGQRFLLDPPWSVDGTSSLLGVGLGASANLNNHLDLRVSIAWPLRDSASSAAYDPRAYFSIGGQF